MQGNMASSIKNLLCMFLLFGIFLLVVYLFLCCISIAVLVLANLPDFYQRERENPRSLEVG